MLGVQHSVRKNFHFSLHFRTTARLVDNLAAFDHGNEHAVTMSGIAVAE
jgi:hypothetical protein